MILHIFVDTTYFTTLPDDVITISLKFTVDKDTTLDVTSPITKDSEAVISKTLHIPLLDDVSRTSELEVEAVAHSVDGQSAPQGRGATTVSPMEHGAAKQVDFNDGKSNTGDVKFSVFYYRFPMDINDFQQNGQAAATKQQQKFMKEYAFLQKRRLRWGESKASSWNNTSERLLAEDLALAQGQRPHRAQERNKHPYGKSDPPSKQQKHAGSAQEKPKLRKTTLSVSYGGVAWPHNTGDQEEKLLQKLHMAEQKRLQLLHSAAEEARKRNQRLDKRIETIKKSRSTISPQEHARLKALLREKEQALRDLRAELENQKLTHRKAVTNAAMHRRSSSIVQAETKVLRSGSNSAPGSGRGRRPVSPRRSQPQVKQAGRCSSRCGGTGSRNRKGPPPSYLTPTSSWASRANLAFPPTRCNNPNSNCSRACCYRPGNAASKNKRPMQEAARRHVGTQRAGNGRAHATRQSSQQRSPMEIPLDIFHDGDTATTVSSSSASLALSGGQTPLEQHHLLQRSVDQDSEEDYVDEIPASKSAAAMYFIQEIRETQEKLEREQQNSNAADTIDSESGTTTSKDSNMNRIIEKYSDINISTQQHEAEQLDVSTSSVNKFSDGSVDSQSSSYRDSLAGDEVKVDEEEEEKRVASTEHILFSELYTDSETNLEQQRLQQQKHDGEDDIYHDIDEIERAIKRLEGRIAAVVEEDDEEGGVGEDDVLRGEKGYIIEQRLLMLQEKLESVMQQPHQPLPGRSN